ncbi:carbohydrate ABC transporter permease [Brachybacterium timonense]|uniref:carbohydrate ABC transporter permease n=1 Tax=Brachybacterium timonense TaxID=2050896 RepID=UPI001BAF1815|nr:carbohydrate ABC transporter permease [Brachybacterium timonense]
MSTAPPFAGPLRRTGPRSIALLLAAMLVAGPFLLPLYWLLRSSVMPNAEIYAWPPRMLPVPSLENLSDALAAAPFDVYLLNSLIVTGLGAGGNLVMATFTAYAFAFIPFPAKKALFILLIGALMVPGHITLVVNYLVISEMGLVNSYLGLVLPGLSNAFGTFLLRQHFLSMPTEVLEAAELDGAGHLRKLLRFVVPMSLPAIVTVGLICVIGEWNSFVWPLIVITSDSMRTLPIGLMTLKDTEGLTNWGPIMAGTLMVALPMLIVYLMGHRQIISGLTGASMRS